ncbi:MAG: hypothetical protein KY459_09785, partial [Acidobacteria bacterium]|nr:hypothetical protein [Acidobacteriota bacterium]
MPFTRMLAIRAVLLMVFLLLLATPLAAQCESVPYPSISLVPTNPVPDSEGLIEYTVTWQFPSELEELDSSNRVLKLWVDGVELESWGSNNAAMSGTKQYIDDVSCKDPATRVVKVAAIGCGKATYAEHSFQVPEKTPIFHAVNVSEPETAVYQIAATIEFPNTKEVTLDADYRYTVFGVEGVATTSEQWWAPKYGTTAINFQTLCEPGGSYPFFVRAYTCASLMRATVAEYEGSLNIPDKTPTVDLSVYREPDGEVIMTQNYHFPVWKRDNADTWWVHIYRNDEQEEFSPDYWWAEQSGTRVMGKYFPKDKEDVNLLRAVARFCAGSAEDVKSVPPVEASCEIGPKKVSGATALGSAVPPQPVSSCPDCVGAPIHLGSGNMRMNDLDPVAGEIQLDRTYDSQDSGTHWFGRGWWSLFDSKITSVRSGQYLVVSDLAGDQFTFEDRDGALVQIDPSPRIHRVVLEHDAANAVWRFGSADSEVRQVYRTMDGKLVGFDLVGGRSYTVGWSADVPTSVSDSWGNWNLTVNSNAEGRISSIVSPNGTWSYEYTTTGHLTRVALDAVTWRTYTYSSTYASAVMTAAHDAAGKLIESHAYDSAGRAISSISEENAVTNITWVTGRVPGEFAARITDGSGKVTTYYTRQVGGRTRTVEIDGICDCGTDDTVFGFEEDGDLVREQNARGYITERTFDGFGKVLSETTALKPTGCDPETDANHCRLSPDSILTAALETSAASRTVNYEYGDPSWPTAVTRISRSSILAPGQETSTTFTYDAETGQILVQNDSGWTGSPAELETRTTTTTLYDGTEGAVFNPGGVFQSSWLTLAQPAGFRRRVDGPRTDVADATDFVYYPVDASVPSGSRGKLAAVRNAAGHITRYENYDALGNAQRIVDANGVVTERTFDTLGRLVSTTTLGVSGCDTTLDPLCSTDITTTRTYAGLGPLQSDTSADGAVTAYTLDDRGRTTTLERGPSAGTMLERMSYDYDPATGLKSADRTLGWNGSAWVETRSQTFDYDSRGQLLFTTFPTGDTVSYEYDAARNLVATTDENHTSANTLYVYDPADHLTEIRQLLDGAWITTRYGYDGDGNLVSVTDPNGNITTYVYDDFGQMIQQSSPVTGTTTYDYDTAGSLVTTTDSRGATTGRAYDVLGRTLSSTTTLGAETEQVGWTWDSGTFGIGRLASMSDELGTVDYTYTRLGQLAREQRSIYGSVYTTAYAYDEEGNRTRLNYPSGLIVETGHDYAGRPVSASTPGGTVYVTSAEYEPFGPMKSLVYGNGTQKVVSHDTRYRPRTIDVAGPAGPVAEWGYSYDGVGNITGIADALDPKFSRTFGYDELNRITQANTGVALWGTGSYTYDAMGNMLSASLGTAQRSFAYQGTTPKLATSTDFSGGTTPVSYDSAGNEVARSATTFDYSSRNNLVETAGLSYRYDGRGLRLVTAGSTGSIAMVASSLVEIEGGEAATGTVTLTQPAPAGGAVVDLISSSSDLTVPSSVTVPEGATTALFTISAAYTAETLPAVVTARWGSTASVAVSVRAMPAVTGIQLTPNDVGGGSSSTGTVTLDRPAPSIGTEVTLTSSDVNAATVPASVMVTDGQSTAIFTVDTSVVENTTTSSIRGTTLSGTSSATLTIRRSTADLASIDLGSGTVVSGYPMTGSVVLTAPAPTGGAVVALESTDPVNAPVPAEVTVPEGETSAPFAIATRPLTSSSTATISGTFGLTQASTLTLLACAVPPMHPGPSSFPQDDSVWSDDTVPGTGIVSWKWSTEQAVSGTKSHTNWELVSGLSAHSFHDAPNWFLGPNDSLFTYVLHDPCHPTRAIMLSWRDENGSWEHRAYWGENLFTAGTDGTASRKRMGDLPQVGDWVRLEVNAADVGLANKSVNAMHFSTYDGWVWFDRSGFGVCTLGELAQPTDFNPAEVVWLEDTYIWAASWNWQWVSDQKASGDLSHSHAPAVGAYSQGFRDAPTVTAGPGDSWSQYVLLDPCNPPREIMLEFRVGNNFANRAYWGENLIEHGTPGTSERVYMGPLPPLGVWTRLEMPAEWIGLVNKAVNGMSFVVYDGRVWWDRTSRVPGTAYDNAAWNRYATQSSTAGSAAATLATDNSTSGNGSLGEVSMTNVEAQPWWEIDLGSLQSIHRIDIWNRTDCCQSDLSDYYVLLSDVPFDSTDLATTLAQPGVRAIHVADHADVRRLEMQETARFVRIQLNGTAALQLAEVK